MPNAEPVAWAGAITGLAVAAIPFLRAFGVNINEDQSNAILGLLAAIIVVGTLFVRSKVTPVGNAEAKIDEAFFASPGSTKPVL